MTNHAPDRFKISSAFWHGLPPLGLEPAVVLRQAGLPLSLPDSPRQLVDTAQFFALWRAVAALNPDPALGLKFATGIPVEHLPPSSLAALHARDFRDSLRRLARFKQLCFPEEMHLTESRGECTILIDWLYATETEPELLVDISFASFVLLGRRGTQAVINPRRIELARPAPRIRALEEHFHCPVKFRARRNAIVFASSDLDRPFVTHNAELLDMLGPQLEKALAGQRAQSRLGERIKWIVKRLLAAGRPDVATVARELGVSARTLQRRITAEGASFRQLLLEARQELVRQYLAQPIEINEAAYLLGYEDPNSFYRAFRTWEGTTPAHWRTAQRLASSRS